jgi:3-deoxy-manno-octulosonate cytidylyltransferase (CMP-KDO synthetase)
MIQHVYERVKDAGLVQDVFVATDNKLIQETVKGFGGIAIMTSEKHQSGTDRIAEAVFRIQDTGYRIQDTDIIVNVQGDEPMVRHEMVDDVIRLMHDRRASISTLAERIDDIKEALDPNIVKVVFDSEGFALYFSRSPIPYHRDIFQMTEGRSQMTDKSLCSVLCALSSEFTIFKHIGIYAYRKDVLLRFSNLPPTKLEIIEKLEQLRALENGFKIKVKETEFKTIGVDTPLDLERVKKCLNLYS